MFRITPDPSYTKDELRTAIKMLDTASELAERNGWPAMARDLAVAMVTLQRFNSDYARMLAAYGQAVQ